MGIKAQVGEMVDALRWSQATIDWAGGDPTKGGLLIGSPLAWAKLLRGTAGWWFGRRGWREDLDDAFAMAESADSMTLAIVLSWTCIGIMNGVLPAGDAAVERIEKTLRTAQASGDDYAVTMIKNCLGFALLWRGDPADGNRGLEMVAQVRNLCLHQQYPLSELPINDLIAARERAKRGDRDDAISVMRKSVDEVLTNRHLLYGISMAGALVETLLDRGAEGDVAEAEAAIARLAAAPADGSAIRDVWLLRMHAQLARARRDEAGYRDHRDRYREIAASLGYEGHMQWAAAMP